MLVTLPPLKIQIRPRKVAIKQWVTYTGYVGVSVIASPGTPITSDASLYEEEDTHELGCNR